MKDRLDLLENTVLEVASELSLLRRSFKQAEAKSKAYSQLLENIKNLLAEKGLMSEEDIEVHIEEEKMIAEAGEDTSLYDYSSVDLKSH